MNSLTKAAKETIKTLGIILYGVTMFTGGIFVVGLGFLWLMLEILACMAIPLIILGVFVVMIRFLLGAL